MALSLDDLTAMMAGFTAAGFRCIKRPLTPTNPVQVDWFDGSDWRRFRLWAFEITHGGGGPEVRDADEYRIQITNGPLNLTDFDRDGATDLMMGFSRHRDVSVGYDRRWLEHWVQKSPNPRDRGSPSVQVDQNNMLAAQAEGMRHLVKNTKSFPNGNVVTIATRCLPAYLRHHHELLGGLMNPADAPAPMAPGDESVWQFCRDRGFVFDPDMLARYIAALAAKPFVIFAGVSGTGKSKMAELVAHYYTRTAGGTVAGEPGSVSGKFVFVPAKGAPDPNRFALVPVRPDWIDNQSILGFVNPITGKYESTQALDLLLRAAAARAKTADGAEPPRHFMLLDEMNLARVEHYFSDWLACVESRRIGADGRVAQQPVHLHRQETIETTLVDADRTTHTIDVPQALEIPTNVVVTGTVNVDETTYAFSPKVLDRAMVIEFDEVDLDGLRRPPAPGGLPAYQFPAELPPFRVATREDYAALSIVLHGHLKAVNGILEEARLHFGYRAANEIAHFMTIYQGMLPDDPADADGLRALDAALLQKVLPRIQGNRAKVETPLARLVFYCRDLGLPGDRDTLEEFDPKAAARLPRSYRRALEMLDAVRSFGFVSFFK